MEITSLGWRTDLGLLATSGSVLEHHDDHVVVRTDANPTYFWGNFLLLHPDAAADLDRWEARFTQVHPAARHVTFGVDGDVDPAPWTERGYGVDRSVVLVTEQVAAGADPGATLRPLDSDADWVAQVRLDVEDADEHVTEAFATARAAQLRSLVDAGHGVWWGAFEGRTLLGSLGVFRAGDGLARYQNVLTHPGARRRGIASALVRTAGADALTWEGVRRLVIVADPDYHAIGLYRRCGFEDRQRHVGFFRYP